MAYRRSQLKSSRIESELYLFPGQQPLTIRNENEEKECLGRLSTLQRFIIFVFWEQSRYKNCNRF